MPQPGPPPAAVPAAVPAAGAATLWAAAPGPDEHGPRRRHLMAVLLRRRDRSRRQANIATRSATATLVQRAPAAHHDQQRGDDRV